MPLDTGNSGAATPPVVPAPTSWLGAAWVPPRVRGLSSRVPARGSSGAATRPVAPTPASWHRATPELPSVLWLQLPPPNSGQLQSRHVSRGSSSRLLAQGSSGAATCPVAPAPASWLRAAPEPPRVPWSSTSCRLLK
jgi:hypothetical protein